MNFIDICLIKIREIVGYENWFVVINVAERRNCLI